MAAAVRPLACVTLAFFNAVSCGETLDPGSASVASLAVSPNTVILIVGEKKLLTVTLRSQAGVTLTGRTVGWSSGNSQIATVSATGEVTAVSPGTTTVTATSENKSGSATITVNPVPVATIQLSDSALALTAGNSDTLTALLKDSTGAALSNRTVTWSSTATSIATVSSAGIVTAIATGTASIKAMSEGKTAEASLTVLSPSIPVNSNATPKTRNVLSYLAGLKNRSDSRVIAGQFVASTGTAQAAWSMFYDTVRVQTGRDVGLVGLDIEGNGWCAPDATEPWCQPHEKMRVNFDSWWMNKAIGHWKQGGLVTLHWHAHNPWTGGPVTDAQKSGGAALDQLITPGSAVHSTWMSELDKVAAGLKQLQDSGVVILWRPLHEANGDAFWWGSQNSSASYVRVWQHMYKYFTVTKGLNNLLWVYAPAVLDNNTVLPMLAQYPGDGYVDMVGMDYYPSTATFNAPPGFAPLASRNKVIGLTEYGYKGSGQVDLLNVINSIQTSMPALAFVIFWNDLGDGKYSIKSNRNSNGFMNHSWVIDRSEINVP
jgi:hypothetical protein